MSEAEITVETEERRTSLRKSVCAWATFWDEEEDHPDSRATDVQS
jgi:hypothetical protein